MWKKSKSSFKVMHYTVKMKGMKQITFTVLLNVTGFGNTCHLRTKINIEKYVIKIFKV